MVQLFAVMIADKFGCRAPVEQTSDASPCVQNGELVDSKVQPLPHTPSAPLVVAVLPPSCVTPPVELEPPSELEPPVPASAQQPLVHSRLPFRVPSLQGQQPHAALQPEVQRGGAAQPTIAQSMPEDPPFAVTPPLEAAVPPLAGASVYVPLLGAAVPPRPNDDPPADGTPPV